MATRTFIVTLLTLVFLIVGGCFLYSFNMRNPFTEVKWIEDYPGAGDRYVTYTPVLRDDNSIKLGPTVGADYGKLRFKDLNNDGVKEAIIQTEVLLPQGDFYSHERHVLEYKKLPAGKPKFVLVDY